MILPMYQKVINLYNLIKQNNIFIGIGLLKKETKNQVKLQKEFYDIYSSNINYNKIVIDINEDNYSEEKNYLNFPNIDEEINYINYLIKITQEKLLSFENGDNFNNGEKKLTLTYEDIFEINEKKNNNGNSDLLGIKSEDELIFEFLHGDGTKQNLKQKKSEINSGKAQYNEEYLNSRSYSNILNITSKNNFPIRMEKIDLNPSKIKERGEKDKDGLNHYKAGNEKENIINNNYLTNNENNENKSELINFNQMKNFHPDNKLRKDSIISDFSCYGNFNNNLYVEQSLFNNLNNTNGYNYYNMCLNKNENEVF